MKIFPQVANQNPLYWKSGRIRGESFLLYIFWYDEYL